MISIDRHVVAGALPYDRLIDAVAAAFAAETSTPLRHRHELGPVSAAPTALLLMPSWALHGRFGIKLVTIQPANSQRNLPTVQSIYLLGDAATGEFTAILDADELTLRRTAAASALASRHLSRADSHTLLMVGTGRLARHLIRAHRAVRPIERVLIWGRTPARATELAQSLAVERSLEASVVSSIDEGLATADVVSSATLSDLPLIRGAALRPGQHIDLVGSYLPTMREADDTAILRSMVYVDSRSGALSEAGDLVQPLKGGIIDAGHIRADLAELVRGRHPGRTDRSQITLFKSVGLAIEDLAAASLVVESLREGRAAS